MLYQKDVLHSRIAEFSCKEKMINELLDFLLKKND